MNKHIIQIALFFIVTFVACKSLSFKEKKTNSYAINKTYDLYFLDLLNRHDTFLIEKNDSVISVVYGNSIDYFYSDSTTVKGHLIEIDGKIVKDGDWSFYKNGKLYKIISFVKDEIVEIRSIEGKKVHIEQIHSPAF